VPLDYTGFSALYSGNITLNLAIFTAN
jgi:hypothetical protein